jgi:hypothetical protein
MAAQVAARGGHALDKTLEPVLHKLLNEVPGLVGVVVSTTEAVCCGQAWNEQEAGPLVATIFPFVAEQVSKLQWGPVRSLCAEYEGATVVHVNLAPLVFTFVSRGSDAGTHILCSAAFIKALEEGFKPLQQACR